MASPDIERYVDRRSNMASAGQNRRDLDHVRRYRQEPRQDHGLVYPPGIELPPGFSKDDGTLVTALVSSTGYARYIGRAVPRLRAVEVGWRVTTGGASITYAEIGICTSLDVPMMATSTDRELTTIGWTDVASTATSAARKITTVEDFEPPNVGSHLWILIVFQASTVPILRAGRPDECGFLVSKAGSARPSVMAQNAVFAEVATSFNDIWLPFRQIQAAN